MKFTLRVKSVNPEFDRDLAIQEHGGKESEDNVHYLWEDELIVKKNVTSFRVRNNVPYELSVEENGKPVSYEIPSCTIIDCSHDDESVTQFAFSKRIIKETAKTQSKDEQQLWFTVFLKGKMKVVSPFEGAYFAKEDFPFDLPEVEAEDNEEDKDEEA
jgi:hypothetical protein